MSLFIKPLMTMKFSEPNVISWIETNLNRISIGLRKTCQILRHRSFHDGKTIFYSHGYLSYGDFICPGLRDKKSV